MRKLKNKTLFRNKREERKTRMWQVQYDLLDRYIMCYNKQNKKVNNG